MWRQILKANEKEWLRIWELANKNETFFNKFTREDHLIMIEEFLNFKAKNESWQEYFKICEYFSQEFRPMINPTIPDFLSSKRA